MKFFCYTFVFVFAVIFVCVVCGSNVVEWTDDDYEEYMVSLDKQGAKPWALLFCDFSEDDCDEIEKEWEALAADKTSGVEVGKVDCNKNVDPCLDFKTFEKDYPIILLAQADGGKPKYSGKEQTVKAWKSWITTELHGDVIPLTTANFKDSVSTGEWLVEFYAYWCIHCKHLAPFWRTLATTEKGNFNVAKLECTENNVLCTEYAVESYPKIFFFKDGEKHEVILPRFDDISLFENFVESVRHPEANDLVRDDDHQELHAEL